MFLVVYAVIMAVAGLSMVVEHVLDTAWEAVAFSLVMMVLFAAAAFFMFKWQKVGYMCMVAALAWQILLGLIGFEWTPTVIANFVAMLMVNLFIIVWLLQDEQRELFH